MRIIADAQVLKPGFDANSGQSLYRSKAWAEYDLGFYAAAVADAGNSNAAAGTCIAAKAYEKLGQTEDARTAWAKFEAQYKAMTPDDLVVEPDCPILAAEAEYEAK